MILLLIGPSGSGKKDFKIACKRYGIRLIKSCTTKPKTDSLDEEVYQFLTDAQFDELIKNDNMLEWIIYNNHKYGTLRNDFTKNCVTIVDKSAFYKLQNFYSGKVFSIYFDISEDECRKRCIERGEKPEVVDEKLKQDKLRLNGFDKKSVDLLIKDSDLHDFDKIIKEHIKTWVVR